MKLSLAFITYNRKDEMLRALNSCISFITDEMEIVIVDNNSNDGGQGEIKSYLKMQNISFNYYYSDENLGVAAGRNLAFKLCKGKYVFFLDDDAVIDTDDLFNKVCSFMDLHHNVAALSLNIYEPETNNYILSQIRDGKNDNYQLAFSFIGGAHALRKVFFDELGVLYPSRLHFGSEELYASLKVWGEGGEIAYVSDFKVNHMPSIINRYDGKERDFNILTNIYIVKKLIFPNIAMKFEYIFFIIRIIKNGFWTKRWRIRIKEAVFQRYDKSEEYKIQFKTLIYLIRTFRFKDVF